MKFEPTEPLVLNYDNLWVLPANEEELKKICDKFNAIGCTSFQLSKEELEAVIDKYVKENDECKEQTL